MSLFYFALIQTEDSSLQCRGEYYTLSVVILTSLTNTSNLQNTAKHVLTDPLPDKIS